MPLIVALALGAAAAPAAAEPPAAEQKLAQDCSAHRFETSISLARDGKPHQSKVKLCGTPGQTDAQWIGTLKDTVVKVAADARMPPAAKTQIIAAVNLEIVRLGASPAVATSVPAPVPMLIEAPPLPAPRKAPSAAGPQYSALPAFPPPVTAAPVAAIGSAGAAIVAPAPYFRPLPRPRLSFSCYTAGDISVDGTCFAFDRDTMITVRAGEPLKNTLLRFVRDGDDRADFALPPLARGKSVRFTLPRAVCSHAVGGKLTIRIVRGPAGKPNLAQVVGTEGPYNLRC